MSYFLLFQQNGDITLKAPLDFESPPNPYKLTVTATNTNDAQKFAAVTVIIHVTDVNEYGPDFGNSNFAAYWPEDTAIGIVAITVTATDADGSVPFKQITYMITDGADDKFEIDQVSIFISTPTVSRNAFTDY